MLTFIRTRGRGVKRTYCRVFDAVEGLVRAVFRHAPNCHVTFHELAQFGDIACSASVSDLGGRYIWELWANDKFALFNINAAKPTPGWNQIMSLPRRLTLAARDELAIEPIGDLESLRHDHRHVEARTLPANREVILEGVAGNAVEIAAEIDTGSAQMVELNVLRAAGKEEYTRIAFYRRRGYIDWDRSDGWARINDARDSLITIDNAYSSELPDVESRAPEIAPFYLPPNETLKLRVFIDKSVVEVFANDRQCLAVRVYPGREDSVGVSLRAQGADATLRSLDVWQMHTIYA